MNILLVKFKLNFIGPFVTDVAALMITQVVLTFSTVTLTVSLMSL